MIDYDDHRSFFWTPDPAIQYLNLLRYNGEVIGATGNGSVIRPKPTTAASKKPASKLGRKEKIRP